MAQMYGFSPMEINDGNCEEFAYLLECEGYGEVCWGTELPIDWWSKMVQSLDDWFTHFAPYHCFIKYNERYYDSECPLGCNYPDELPFYQRELKDYFGD